ncbi:MAG: YebC/PmpR family DNA-binding transcriptional regulator [Patescibacteria group bacterium]|nr:YebC/PmpR family DNA-binding transcriptional regulator [Patescibacteria group bacterium]
MSGHSKWATIKHQKGAADQKRGKIFTKIGRMIAIAAKEGGGGDPMMNFKLRLALEKAKQANMPQVTVEKAVKRGTGEGAEGQIEEATYGAVGPEGLAIIIKTATDNKNRTLSEIKNILTKNGGKFGESGSLSWQFTPCGIIDLGACKLSEEQELAVIEAGAEDIKIENNETLIYTAPQDLQKVKEKLDALQIKIESAELGFAPKNTVAIDVSRVEKLLNALEEHDDVQEIYTNLKSNP